MEFTWIELVAIWIMLFYGIMILLLIIGQYRVALFTPGMAEAYTSFSVVVPFRNEEAHLPALLQSLDRLDYPRDRFEVLLVDDASSDASVAAITAAQARSDLKITILKAERHSASAKKDAIETAIGHSNAEWIVTTDADCIVHSLWLRTLNAYITTHDVSMIMAPVQYRLPNSFLEALQYLEHLGLQGVTLGSFGLGIPTLSNGANFGYKKAVFYDLGGFVGNNHIASGDDTFLLQKAEHRNTRIGFVYSDTARVTTTPVNGLNNMMQQRVRWASKTSRSSWHTQCIGGLTLCANALLLLLLVQWLFNPTSLKLILVCFLVKYSLDHTLANVYAKRMGWKYPWFYTLPCTCVYPIQFVMVALLSLSGGYRWKGRPVRK